MPGHPTDAAIVEFLRRGGRDNFFLFGSNGGRNWEDGRNAYRSEIVMNVLAYPDNFDLVDDAAKSK